MPLRMRMRSVLWRHYMGVVVDTLHFEKDVALVVAAGFALAILTCWCVVAICGSVWFVQLHFVDVYEHGKCIFFMIAFAVAI